MAPYQQHPAPHSWDRWPQHQAGSDYVMMNDMVGYDTRTMPSSAPLQRPVMAPQYVMGNSYGDSPVTPMSASNYPGHSQFGDYGSYSQPSPSLTSPFQQHPDRFAHRPMAPPTPPLDSDSHSIYSRDGQASYTSRDTSRRSSTKPVTVVKTEDVTASRTPKTIEPFKKEDGSLQYESKEKFDCLLRLIPKTLKLEDSKDHQHQQQQQQQPDANPAITSLAVKEVRGHPVTTGSERLCAHREIARNLGPRRHSRNTSAPMQAAIGVSLRRLPSRLTRTHTKESRHT